MLLLGEDLKKSLYYIRRGILNSCFTHQWIEITLDMFCTANTFLYFYACMQIQFINFLIINLDHVSRLTGKHFVCHLVSYRMGRYKEKNIIVWNSTHHVDSRRYVAHNMRLNISKVQPKFRKLWDVKLTHASYWNTGNLNWVSGAW